MMKKYLTMMLAALMFCAMSFTVAGKAWAEDGTVTTKAASASKGDAVNVNTGGGHQNTWHVGYDSNAGGGFLEKILSGSGIGGNYGSSTGVSMSSGTTAAAGMVQTQGTGVTAGATGVSGVGGGFTMPSMNWSGGSGIFSTAINKLLNLFGNVKLLLYVLAAFGLVGFAFMAIFGKVRWGWVCALAFGLAAVAAAGQVIDYVTQAGIGGAMVDTLGANGVDW